MKSLNRNKLSIQVGLYGLSFFLKTEEGENLLTLDYYPEKGENFLSFLQAEIKNLHIKETAFDRVNLFHHHPYQVLIPFAIYKPENEKDYLKTNVKVFKYDHTERDRIESVQGVNVYIPFEEISTYLKENFSGIQSYHSLTPLIEYTLGYTSKNTIKNAVFIRVMQRDFQMVVIKDSKFIFANTFPLDSKDDLLFYVLFIWEELQLENYSPEIFLTGQNEDLFSLKKELEAFKPEVRMNKKTEHDILSMYL